MSLHNFYILYTVLQLYNLTYARLTRERSEERTNERKYSKHLIGIDSDLYK